MKEYGVPNNYWNQSIIANFPNGNQSHEFTSDMKNSDAPEHLRDPTFFLVKDLDGITEQMVEELSEDEAI